MAHKTSDWAKAHSTFTIDDHSSAKTELVADMYADYWRAIHDKMPHGHLMNDNVFFDSHKSGKMYLVHGTCNLDAILSSGVLYASAGCLVGAVYCAQAFPEGNLFRMHNLGDYILHKEVPNILSAHNKTKRNSSLLLIEVDIPMDSNPLKAGVDYLKMGQIHYDLYVSLQHLLSPNERADIEQNVTAMISGSTPFLDFCNQAFLTDSKPGINLSKDFIHRLNNASAELPMLGYLYFEAVSEYLMLNSTDPLTIELAKRKEFNNWLYKQLMYGIYKELRGNFSISKFNPSIEELRDYVQITKSLGHLNVNVDELVMYVAARIMYWVNTRFFTKPGTSIDWLNTPQSFDRFAAVASPLIGHAIHRQLRELDRYRQFYFYFDHMKALEIWNYWNKANIAIPFNGVFPKGEIGINPAFTNMSYKIYQARATSEGSNYLEIMHELPIEIVPRLIELDKSFMRAGGHYSLSKQRNSQYA